TQQLTKATKRRTSSLTLVRSPKNLLMQKHGTIKRARLKHGRFAILPRNRNTTTGRDEPPRRVSRKPRVNNVHLPRVQIKSRNTRHHQNFINEAIRPFGPNVHGRADECATATHGHCRRPPSYPYRAAFP